MGGIVGNCQAQRDNWVLDTAQLAQLARALDHMPIGENIENLVVVYCPYAAFCISFYCNTVEYYKGCLTKKQIGYLFWG